MVNPRSTAFFASRPAAIMTSGLDVLVQLVIAAMTTDPSFTVPGASWTAVVGPTGSLDRGIVRSAGAGFFAAWAAAFIFGSASANDFRTSGRFTRSCGRAGPAMLGTTVDRSRLRVSEYAASGVSRVWNRPCSLQ